jgi:uncharacterized protein (UPF0548 family)
LWLLHLWFDEGMFLLRQPDEERLEHFLNEQKRLEFSYTFVEVTHPEKMIVTPKGFIKDHNRIFLGKGEVTFEKAKEAIKNWKAYALGWTKIYPESQPQQGQTFCVLVNHFGFYSLSSLRIVYIVDEPRRFAYAIGTLPGHVEKGEERFMVEWLPDDSVHYDLLAFSRPQHALVYLGYPVARQLQKRFAEDSKRAMQKAVLAEN